MLQLPVIEHHQAALGTTGTISLLAHGLLLGVLGWAFPYTMPEPIKDTGISIDLAQIVAPAQEPPAANVPSQAVAEPEPPVMKELPEPEPAPAPQPLPKKVEKPKTPVKKAETSKKAMEKPRAVAAARTEASKTHSAKAQTGGEANQVKTVAARTSVSTAPISTPGNPRPPYPDLARKRGQEGTVQIRCQVNSDGKVVNVSLARSSGHKLLDDAAMKTVAKWKFRPAMSGGTAVAGSVVVPVDFRLK